MSRNFLDKFDLKSWKKQFKETLNIYRKMIRNVNSCHWCQFVHLLDLFIHFFSSKLWRVLFIHCIIFWFFISIELSHSAIKWSVENYFSLQTARHCQRSNEKLGIITWCQTSHVEWQKVFNTSRQWQWERKSSLESQPTADGGKMKKNTNFEWDSLTTTNNH